MNPQLEEYIESHTTPESEVLRHINRRANVEQAFPHMLSGHVQGRILSMLSKMIRPSHILEIGTFVGYSALCLAEGLSEDGRLLTIEKNDELEDTIRQNLALSPLGEKIDLQIGSALEILSEFTKYNNSSPNAGVKQQSTPPLADKGGSASKPTNRQACIEHLNQVPAGGRSVSFDLVFIDADKREYTEYLEAVLPLVRQGGWILADNTLWDGHIIDPEYDKDRQTQGLRCFNDFVHNCPELEHVILPIRDGLTVIRKSFV